MAGWLFWVGGKGQGDWTKTYTCKSCVYSYGQVGGNGSQRARRCGSVVFVVAFLVIIVGCPLLDARVVVVVVVSLQVVKECPLTQLVFFCFSFVAVFAEGASVVGNNYSQVDHCTATGER